MEGSHQKETIGRLTSSVPPVNHVAHAILSTRFHGLARGRHRPIHLQLQPGYRAEYLHKIIVNTFNNDGDALRLGFAKDGSPHTPLCKY